MNSKRLDVGGAHAARLGVIAACMVGFLAGCAGADATGGDGSESTGGFDVSISPDSLILFQGQSGTATVSVQGAAQGTFTLSVLGLPDSITATFNPPVISGAFSSTLTVTTRLRAPVGRLPVAVNAKAAGGNEHGVPLLLIVNAAPIVTVTKVGSGSGTVTSDPAGIDCGGVCGTSFAVGTSVTLTAAPAAGSALASWAGACAGTSLTCTVLTTAAVRTNSVTATFNTTAPAIALGVSPSPVSVQAGNTVNATVTVTRINGYAGPVTLSTSVPSGLTVTANPQSITGTTSTLTITAATSLAAGVYPVSITAMGSGVTQQTTALPVQVTPGPQGGPITFNFATCETAEIPVWAAVQSGSGPWTRITPTNNVFTFTPGATGGLAFVTRAGTDTNTSVLYTSAAEITAIALSGPCSTTAPTGTKRLQGSFANAGAIEQGYLGRVVIGGASYTRTSNFVQNFTFTNAPRGVRDVIADRKAPFSNQARMILRRDTNYENGATMPLLDFESVEAFTPITGRIMTPNLPDTTFLDVSLLTRNGGSETYYSIAGAAPPTGGVGIPFHGLPDSLLRAGDYHSISAVALPLGGDGKAFRFIQFLEHSASSQTFVFGPQLGSSVAVSTLSTTPYLRMRAQVPSRTTYFDGAGASFSQNANSVSILMTGAYLGSAPNSWALDVPDLSGAGYDPAWALRSGAGVSWNVSAVSGNFLPFIGGAPVDRAQITGAGAGDSLAVAGSSLRVPFARPPHR